jgi:hypothetical protein
MPPTDSQGTERLDNTGTGKCSCWPMVVARGRYNGTVCSMYSRHQHASPAKSCSSRDHHAAALLALPQRSSREHPDKPRAINPGSESVSRVLSDTAVRKRRCFHLRQSVGSDLLQCIPAAELLCKCCALCLLHLPCIWPALPCSALPGFPGACPLCTLLNCGHLHLLHLLSNLSTLSQL